jgi:hypothetical protein
MDNIKGIKDNYVTPSEKEFTRERNLNTDIL